MSWLKDAFTLLIIFCLIIQKGVGMGVGNLKMSLHASIIQDFLNAIHLLCRILISINFIKVCGTHSTLSDPLQNKTKQQGRRVNLASTTYTLCKVWLGVWERMRVIKNITMLKTKDNNYETNSIFKNTLCKPCFVSLRTSHFAKTKRK